MRARREYKITEEGAHKVKVKYLLHKGVGAKKLQLRLFTIEVGGYTPLEKHAHEHGVFMLRGRALVRGGDKEVVVSPRDARMRDFHSSIREASIQEHR